MTLPLSCKGERRFPKLGNNKKQIRTNYGYGDIELPFYSLCRKYHKIAVISEAIEEYAAKCRGKKYYTHMTLSNQLIKILLFFWILSCLWYLSAF